MKNDSITSESPEKLCVFLIHTFALHSNIRVFFSKVLHEV